MHKDSHQPEKEPHSNPPHKLRRSLPKESKSHLEPAQPKQREKSQARDSKFPQCQSSQIVRRGSLCHVDVAVRWNDRAWVLVQASIGDEPIAQAGAVFIADPPGPVVKTHSQPTVLGNCTSHAQIIP